MLKINLLILFVSLTLASCARVVIKDAEWCGDVGERGARCFRTLTDGQRDLDFDQWQKERFGMVCTQPENFTDSQTAILKLCSIRGARCSYDSKKKIMTFMGKMHDQIERTYLISEEAGSLVKEMDDGEFFEVGGP